MCVKHYERARRSGGDPTVMKRPNYGSYRSVAPNGYVRIYRPGHALANTTGHIYEHRLVLFEAGVDVAGMEVHHINGDKTDNRIENLAVLTPEEHQKRHLSERGVIRNQFGVWPVKGHRHTTHG